MNIKPQRLKGEKFIAYRKRRREGNAAIKQYLKGQVAYAASEIVLIPVLGKDLQADLAVINGQYRDVVDVKLANGKDSRVGRTRGVAYLSLSKRNWPEEKRQSRRALVRQGRKALLG